MLPTRKGSRNHKAVDSDANFVVLRKQADLGLVAVRRGRLQRRRIMAEKLAPYKGNVMLLAHCLEGWKAIQWNKSTPGLINCANASTVLQLHGKVEALAGCLSRMMGNDHARFSGGKGPQGACCGRHLQALTYPTIQA